MRPLTPRPARSRLVALLVVTLLLVAFGIWLAWSTPQPLHAPTLSPPPTLPPRRPVPPTPGGAGRRAPPRLRLAAGPPLGGRKPWHALCRLRVVLTARVGPAPYAASPGFPRAEPAR